MPIDQSLMDPAQDERLRGYGSLIEGLQAQQGARDAARPPAPSGGGGGQAALIDSIMRAFQPQQQAPQQSQGLLQTIANAIFFPARMASRAGDIVGQAIDGGARRGGGVFHPTPEQAALLRIAPQLLSGEQQAEQAQLRQKFEAGQAADTRRFQHEERTGAGGTQPFTAEQNTLNRQATATEGTANRSNQMSMHTTPQAIPQSQVAQQQAAAGHAQAETDTLNAARPGLEAISKLQQGALRLAPPEMGVGQPTPSTPSPTPQAAPAPGATPPATPLRYQPPTGATAGPVPSTGGTASPNLRQQLSQQYGVQPIGEQQAEPVDIRATPEAAPLSTQRPPARLKSMTIPGTGMTLDFGKSPAELKADVDAKAQEALAVGQAKQEAKSAPQLAAANLYVDAMEGLSRRSINTESDPMRAGLRGFSNKANYWLNQPDQKLYFDWKESFITMLRTMAQNTGAVTDRDAVRLDSAMPSAFATSTEAQAKFGLIRALAAAYAGKVDAIQANDPAAMKASFDTIEGLYAQLEQAGGGVAIPDTIKNADPAELQRAIDRVTKPRT